MEACLLTTTTSHYVNYVHDLLIMLEIQYICLVTMQLTIVLLAFRHARGTTSGCYGALRDCLRKVFFKQ